MSDKPIAERLQVKGTRRLAVLAAPPELDAAIAAPRADPSEADVVLLFTPDHAAFHREVAARLPHLRPDAILWVAYPKLSSKLATDISRDTIHRDAPALGLDTIAQIALDPDWSALRLKRL